MCAALSGPTPESRSTESCGKSCGSSAFFLARPLAGANGAFGGSSSRRASGKGRSEGLACTGRS